MAEAPVVRRCACGTELAPTLLACPVCHRLVHSETLKGLLAEADDLERLPDIRGALAALRRALELLPAGSGQYQAVSSRAARLSDLIDSGAVPATPTTSKVPPPTGSSVATAKDSEGRAWWKIGSAAGALAMLGWKLEAIVVFLLTKAKLLLAGLGKTSTLFTMVLSLGLYWSLWGVWFALGLVLSIYVHEMGHVAALRRFGIQASAPMFLPGFGAMVRMKQYPHTVKEDARIGLAGPVWGLGASIVVLAAYVALDHPMLAAIAAVGAWINLFNLVPFLTLDGGRGFRALARPQRWIAIAVLAAVWLVTREGLLILIGIAAVTQAFSGAAPRQGDSRTLWTYVGLIVCLSAVAAVPVPT